MKLYGKGSCNIMLYLLIVSHCVGLIFYIGDWIVRLISSDKGTTYTIYLLSTQSIFLLCSKL